MKKIAIMTDSNSGITQEKGKELGICVLPMPFFINEELYFEEITLTQDEFYRYLNEYDEIVHIPMSSGLSGSCETAMTLAQEYEGRVQVVNNQRISVTQEQAVYDAMLLRDAGKDAAQIKEILETEKFESTIYITVDTLKYLKKGGRITPAAAALGTVLNLKPVLQIQGEKLDAFAKVRGWKAAKRTMLKAIETDLKERFAGKEDQIVLGMAYTCSQDEAREWKEEIHEKFPQFEIMEAPLSLSVACHIGPGSMAITCTKKVNI